MLIGRAKTQASRGKGEKGKKGRLLGGGGKGGSPSLSVRGRGGGVVSKGGNPFTTDG